MRGLFLLWEMSFRMQTWGPRKTQIIRGVSHLRFGTDGKVVYHRDYWDTGEELYAQAAFDRRQRALAAPAVRLRPGCRW